MNSDEKKSDVEKVVVKKPGGEYLNKKTVFKKSNGKNIT